MDWSHDVSRAIGKHLGRDNERLCDDRDLMNEIRSIITEHGPERSPWNTLEGIVIPHNVTVAGLRELLTDLRLQDTDVLIPNQVRNLAIYRAGRYLGFVNLLEDQNQIEWGEEE